MTDENRKMLERINAYAENTLGEIDPQKVPVSVQLEQLRPVMEEIATEKGRQSFIDTALGRSAIHTGVEPTVDSEILTLSTCTGVGHATRWVVQAALRTEE